MKAEPQTLAVTACDVCGATAARELYTAKDRLRNSTETFSIVACNGCGTLRTLPEMTDRELASFYPGDYWGGVPTDKWIRKTQAEKTSFLQACGLVNGTILDVGCGAGFFLRALDGDKWNRYGVEIGEPSARSATDALGAGRVFTGRLIEAEFDDATFDVVTLWSALEHTNEPRANLVEARRVLKESGTLIVQVPNVGSYQTRVFGGDWSAMDAPRHRYHFNQRTLGKLLSETGFKVSRSTLFSSSHNAHALRQSLKAKMHGLGPIGLVPFLFSIPFIKPFDWAMTALGHGATLTVAASVGCAHDLK